jgi:hypothetical protein
MNPSENNAGYIPEPAGTCSICSDEFPYEREYISITRMNETRHPDHSISVSDAISIIDLCPGCSMHVKDQEVIACLLDFFNHKISAKK